MSSYAVLADTLERVSHKHAEIIKKLEKTVQSIEYRTDDNLVGLLLYYLNELRKLRKEVSDAVNSLEESEDIWDNRYGELRDVIGVLSEYMVIVGFEYEKSLLQRISELAKLIGIDSREIENDIKSIDAIQERLSPLAEKFY